MKILTNIASRFRTGFGKAILVVIISTLILRFPWLLDWCDKMLKDWILGTADAIRTLALPIILAFAKSFTETGGSVPITKEAAERAEPISKQDKP